MGSIPSFNPIAAGDIEVAFTKNGGIGVDYWRIDQPFSLSGFVKLFDAKAVRVDRNSQLQSSLSEE